MIREYREAEDRAWAEARMSSAWGDALQARRGELIDVLALPGFVAEEAACPRGIATYRIDGADCELAFIAAFEPRRGVGTTLLDAVVRAAVGCDRIWLVTTNDNVDALRFYQRRGFRLAAVRPGAVDAARESLKPSIGRIGAYGIPIRDELELELVL